jgi:hypothetical protein
LFLDKVGNLGGDFWMFSKPSLGTDHLTWREGGYGFLFRSEFFFRITRVRIFFFVAVWLLSLMSAQTFIISCQNLVKRFWSLSKGTTIYRFFLKNILIPKVAEKNILILVEEKRKCCYPTPLV